MKKSIKSTFKQNPELIDSARLALQMPGLNQLMEEVGQRADRREAEKKSLVEKRQIKHL